MPASIWNIKQEISSSVQLPATELNDRMFLDQDFTERAVYTLEQKQKSNTISEEIVFKQNPTKDGNGQQELSDCISP